MSRRAAFAQVAKVTGKAPASAETSARLPGCLRHLWDWFVALLPVYAVEEGAVRPAELAADIKARFGMRATGFEIGLLLDLLELWRTQVRPEQEKD
ncbi:hypothetical protein [uncultured Sneathiella sp.]|jgi:hypothetical protein|uniref:hypothetical protein n=1 Tax=uncultured Sneathiella sp. TaxID=879315 RepID=UPI0030D6E47F|tara:strand:+ start:3277 stop:3564 length:288 start_codon:yes stop_codon:yes gene_type:complete